MADAGPKSEGDGEVCKEAMSFGSLRLLGLGTLEGVDDVLVGTTPVKELVIIRCGG
jgi:hypothetical protein